MRFGIGAVAGAIGILVGGDAGVGVSVDGVAAAPGATHATGGETDAVGLYERIRRKSLVGDFGEKRGRGSVGGGIGKGGLGEDVHIHIHRRIYMCPAWSLVSSQRSFADGRVACGKLHCSHHRGGSLCIRRYCCGACYQDKVPDQDYSQGAPYSKRLDCRHRPCHIPGY